MDGYGQRILSSAATRERSHSRGITPDPAPAVSSPSPGDRSGRQSLNGYPFSTGYRKQRFGYLSVGSDRGRNAYSKSLLPACTSSPAWMLRGSRFSRTPVLATERILCDGEGLSGSLLSSRFEHHLAHRT